MVRSRQVVRTLPGILQSGLWRTLASLPPARTRGLVTDVGNDIIYGFPPARILEWVEETVERLQEFTPDIVLTELPLPMSAGSPSRRSWCFARSSRRGADCLSPRSWTRPNA